MQTTAVLEEGTDCGIQVQELTPEAAIHVWACTAFARERAPQRPACPIQSEATRAVPRLLDGPRIAGARSFYWWQLALVLLAWHLCAA